MKQIRQENITECDLIAEHVLWLKNQTQNYGQVKCFYLHEIHKRTNEVLVFT